MRDRNPQWTDRHFSRMRVSRQSGADRSTLGDQAGSIAQNAGFGTTGRAKVRDGTSRQSGSLEPGAFISQSVSLPPRPTPLSQDSSGSLNLLEYESYIVVSEVEQSRQLKG